MIRTVISLTREEKAWLDRAARRERISMTQLVQKAIRRMRETSDSDPGGFARLLRESAGIWRAGDGLDYQSTLRREWDDRG